MGGGDALRVEDPAQLSDDRSFEIASSFLHRGYTDMIRTAVVGLNQGLMHVVEVLANPRFQLVAVCDLDEKKLGWLRGEAAVDDEPGWLSRAPGGAAGPRAGASGPGAGQTDDGLAGAAGNA